MGSIPMMLFVSFNQRHTYLENCISRTHIFERARNVWRGTGEVR